MKRIMYISFTSLFFLSLLSYIVLGRTNFGTRTTLKGKDWKESNNLLITGMVNFKSVANANFYRSG